MSFLDYLKAVPNPITLSIQDLVNLDDSDLKAVIEAPAPVKSLDEAA